jgi:hypothetical protein
MSSLFGQLSGFQFPDVMMNSGPLPSTAGGPAGSDGSVDGVINGTSALLENISPYALGKSARTGSDRNYQQIPHRFQYIIPRLWIPHFSSETFASASHAVDQGDIAFFMFGGSRAWWTCRDQYQTRAPQSAFGSIDMVNYILLCLQASKTGRWGHIRKDLVEHDPFFKAMDRRARQANPEPFDAFNVFRAVRLLVQQQFAPHGICAGSEHQGGQHEHQGGRPVQAAVIITMTVDGKNVDLVNYWYDKSMVAGDELIFRLEKQDCRATKEFHISRYYKDPVTVPAQIDAKKDWDYAYWQLVPAILDSTQPSQPEPAVPEWWCDHRSQGYWRIAQTFQTRKQNNVNAFHRGMPLEVTFAPVWQSFAECEDLRGWSESYIQTCVTQHDNAQELAARVTIGPDETVTVWTYRGAEVLQITDAYAEDHYRLEFVDKTRCKMLGATVLGRGAELAETHPPKLPKHTTECWHVIFCADVDAVAQVYEPHVKETKNAQKITGTDALSFQHEIAHKAGADGVTHADFLVTFTKVPHAKNACGRCKVTMTEQYLAKNKAFYNDFDNKFWGVDNESLPAEAPVAFNIVYFNRDRVPEQLVPDRQGGPPSPPQPPILPPIDIANPPPLNGAQAARLPAPALGLGLEVPEVVAIKKKRAKAGDFLRDAGVGVSTDDCGRSGV